jgi:hypothetical protein
MIRAWIQCFVKNGKFADCRGDGNGKTVWLSNSLGMSQSRRSHRLPKAHLVLSNTNQSNDARLSTAVLSRGKILPPFAASFGRQFRFACGTLAPPLREISRRFSSSIEAKPRFDVLVAIIDLHRCA